MKILVLLAAILFAISVASCDRKTNPDPAPTAPMELATAAREDAPVVKDEDLEDVLKMTLEMLEPGNHIEAARVDSGYTVQVVKDGEPAERTRVCCGGGIPFVKCAVSAIRQYGGVYVTRCSSQHDNCGEYCAYVND